MSFLSLSVFRFPSLHPNYSPSIALVFPDFRHCIKSVPLASVMADMKELSVAAERYKEEASKLSEVVRDVTTPPTHFVFLQTREH